MTSRLGAYLLPGDPVWLRSSLRRYYDLLDELVVLVPTDATGWTGRPLPVDECLEIIGDVDVRGIARHVQGAWEDRAQPMRAETAQRQAGLDALAGRVDWVLQVDNDEVLPDPAALLGVLERAPSDVVGVEWPMRVLYRRLSATTFAAVCSPAGRPVVEYPGSVLVQPRAQLADGRRPGVGAIARCVVVGDVHSLQIRQTPGPREVRIEVVESDQVILHNSWGRSPRQILQKIRSWGHASGATGMVYFGTRWWSARWTWRWQRNLHPFADGLWPRLQPLTIAPEILDPRDRVGAGGRGSPQTKRLA
ncbi:hypothetical protein [Janibacter sp. GS2]|uniref:hypothetical protein n=1 Tax=Janibacter sp. GS2 TaxID=3442646 RepID=UPI003EC1380C